MANGPVQIVLNTDDFRVLRDPGKGGASHDFFAGRDVAFNEHKQELQQQLTRAKEVIAAAPVGSLGYVKVTLRQSAWAKSHRPVQNLFKAERADLVGATGLGQMLFEVTPRALEQIVGDVNRAEPETRLVQTKEGKSEPRPSRTRSEVGAIEKVEPFGAPDKRAFTIDTALAWLANPRAGGGYRVELFVVPPARGQADLLPAQKREAWRTFLDGLRALGSGVIVERINVVGSARPTLSVRLETADRDPVIQLDPIPLRRSAAEVAPIDLSRARHERLLGFLDRHPLVRNVKLPPILERSTASTRAIPGTFAAPPRTAGRNYPTVGVIDGGVGDALNEWIRGRWGLLAESDRDTGHGSFIGGLLVAGQGLNGPDVIPESDGCDLVDIDVFPSDADPLTFRQYFANGVADFLEEVDTAVQECRARYGVRVFNFSINTLSAISLDSYSVEATKLDQISERADAIIVISGGNLESQDCRPEWASDPTTALAQLAAARNDALYVPAESIRNVAVTALNPPGVPNCVAHAPANYSRRGPGLRTGVKPDFAHVGGAGSTREPLRSGLFSVDGSGQVRASSGTSYATPSIAKTLALLDRHIEGEISRETLLALAVHHSYLPDSLRDDVLASVVRHLVGFGTTLTVDEILSGNEQQITLVFASRLMIRQELRFNFTWPQSLVLERGKCKGRASLTLVSTPPLDYRFDAEFVRVNVEASLQQQLANGHWQGRLRPAYLPGPSTKGTYEAALIEHGLKWSPTKIYQAAMRGVGASSNWRLVVDYLTRSGEELPPEGVPFSAVLTIADPDRERPIFNELRQSLQAVGVQTADIRTAARIVPRV